MFQNRRTCMPAHPESSISPGFSPRDCFTFHFVKHFLSPALDRSRVRPHCQGSCISLFSRFPICSLLSQGKATWDPPAEYAWREIVSTDAEHEGRAYFENWVTKEVRPSPLPTLPLPLLPSSQSFNSLHMPNLLLTPLSKVTWDRPASLGWSRRSFNKTFWWNVVTGEAARSAPTDVFGFDDGQGNRFYIDPKTVRSYAQAPIHASRLI